MACDNQVTVVLGAIVLLFVAASASPACDVLVRIESGPVCGARRWDESGRPYASFRGVPYAKQPEGDLRFKDLEPLEPFDNILNATEEGPICPQNHFMFEKMLEPKVMSESCILANIHTPMDALPGNESGKPGRSILVVIHDGNFNSGSGDSDIYGPEFLMTRHVVVITFNYRLNVFGFLSLDTPQIPGNQGLRDAITLLKWVQRNGQAFGGNPSDVTLLGIGSGATMAHLLTLSPASKGLFKRAALISGTAIQTSYTISPKYAQQNAESLLENLGIDCNSPEEIHRQLIDMPLEKILSASEGLEFSPVIETCYPGVTTVINEEPEILIKNGAGNRIPILIGFGNAEMFTYQHEFEKKNIVDAIKKDVTKLVPTSLLHKLPKEEIKGVAMKIKKFFFRGKITIEKYLRYLTDFYFVFPALRLAQWRADVPGAPAFVYLCAYEAEYSVIKDTYNLTYVGSGHGEDMTYVFRTNAVHPPGPAFPPHSKDAAMVEWMTRLIVQFMFCSHPACNEHISKYDVWPASTGTNVHELHYQVVRKPQTYFYTEITPHQKSMIKFFNTILPDTR